MKRNKASDRNVWVEIGNDLDSSLALEVDDSFKCSKIYHRIQMLRNESDKPDVCDAGEIADGGIIDCGIILR